MRWAQGHERLMPSLTNSSDVDHVWTPKKTGFEFGTGLPYAKGHQDGTGAGWVPKRAKDKSKYAYTVPKRVTLGVTQNTFGEIMREMQGHIFGRTGGNRTRGGMFA